MTDIILSGKSDSESSIQVLTWQVIKRENTVLQI